MELLYLCGKVYTSKNCNFILKKEKGLLKTEEKSSIVELGGKSIAYRTDISFVYLFPTDFKKGGSQFDKFFVCVYVPRLLRHL